MQHLFTNFVLITFPVFLSLKGNLAPCHLKEVRHHHKDVLTLVQIKITRLWLQTMSSFLIVDPFTSDLGHSLQEAYMHVVPTNVLIMPTITEFTTCSVACRRLLVRLPE